MSSPESSAPPERAVASPQLLRRINAEAVMRVAFENRAFEASDVIAATGMTRSTVLGLCAELAGTGWLVEIEDARAAGAYRKGRPARRYRLNAGAATLVAVDAGQHHIVVAVTDLAGTVLARHHGRFTRRGGQHRLSVIRSAVDAALRAAATAAAPLLCVVGIPAPVDSAGASPAGDGFWRMMNPGLTTALTGYGRTVIENDANLAALAERSRGAGTDTDSFAVLLSGERFGAGIMLDGHLLRGRNGGAGELRLLELVEEVGSADGFGFLAREWARRDARAGVLPAGSPLAALAPARITAEDVFDAAAQADPTAEHILDRLGDRLARIAEVLVSLLDVERVIVAGGTAAAAAPIIERAGRVLAESFYPPLPTLAASALGGDVVILGAIERALQLVRADPLGFTLRGDVSAH